MQRPPGTKKVNQVAQKYVQNSPASSRCRKAKREGPSEPTEKRLRRFSSKPSLAVEERIERAFAHRLYLIGREPLEAEIGCLSCKFHVLGATKNVYTVTVSRRPDCTCPDSLKGNVCKHRLFVFLRVLKVGKDNPFLWQRALLSTEVVQLLRPITNPEPGAAVPGAEVLADLATREAFATLTQANGSGSSEAGAGPVKRREVEGVECPICYEVFKGGPEAVVFCCSCGNNIHQDCFDHWKEARRGSTVTCVLCRAPWAALQAAGSGATSGHGGYLNLRRPNQELPS